MAHDGSLGGFHLLSCPLAAAGVAPFDVPHALMCANAGWEHGAELGELEPSQSQSPSPPSLAASAAVGGGGEDAGVAALMELLASRLGVRVRSPPSSRYALIHSTPVGSPSEPVAPCVLAGDAVLAECATRPPSCFPASGGNLSRVASSKSLLGEQAPAAAPLPGDVKQKANDGPCLNRKASGGKSKAKDEVVTTTTPKSREPEARAKKCKLSTDAAHDEEQMPAAGDACYGNDKGMEVATEPHKDYIHVRARRGQATDSHSLAERVRREKIGERMKLLQDLVPGCSKVTGKALMLDEIINYVQSLQRQVEFLSMKLSAVNPCVELDVNSFIPKDANNKLSAPATSSMAQPLPPSYALVDSSLAFCYTSSPGTAAQSVVTNASHGIPDQSSLKELNPQMGSLWEEDDLQTLVLMGFRGNM